MNPSLWRWRKDSPSKLQGSRRPPTLASEPLPPPVLGARAGPQGGAAWRGLPRVLRLSRYLIRPSADCHNLASHVLGLLLRRLPRDFERCYGYAPWLVETFVDESRYAGTCYRAANWMRIGRTEGERRRQRGRRHGETKKAICVYPLVDDSRLRMGVPLCRGLGSVPLDAGLEGEPWVGYGFDGAPLGDRRLSRRLIVSAAAQAENPGRAFCSLERGSNAVIKGHYRLIEHPATDAITAENIPNSVRTRLDPVGDGRGGAS